MSLTNFVPTPKFEDYKELFKEHFIMERRDDGDEHQAEIPDQNQGNRAPQHDQEQGPKRYSRVDGKSQEQCGTSSHAGVHDYQAQRLLPSRRSWRIVTLVSG